MSTHKIKKPGIMVAGIGVDIVSVQRIRKLSEKWPLHFGNKIFTDAEIEYCTSKTGSAVFQSFAVRFAAKEAFKKALTAAGKNFFLNWKDVWVAHSKDDVPVLQFSSRLKNETAHWRFHVSLSHESTVAVAVVLIETKD